MSYKVKKGVTHMPGFVIYDHIPYSRKVWQGIKFGGLAVCLPNKNPPIFHTHIIHTVILYQTAKFKFANN